MEVRLTDAGRFTLQVNHQVVNVSTDRAFAMMESDLAVQDAGFMRMYKESHPKPMPKPEPKKPDQPETGPRSGSDEDPGPDPDQFETEPAKKRGRPKKDDGGKTNETA